MLLTLAAPSGGRAQGALPARVLEPCGIDLHTQYWASLVWVNDQLTAPRDGLLWRGVFAAPPSSPNSNFPQAGAVTIEVVAEGGSAVLGTVEEISDGRKEILVAWHPGQPLPPTARYTITVTLDNKRVTSCPSAPTLTQSFAITTSSELTSTPPEPPLEAIIYGQAWGSSAWVCCEPLDRQRCPAANSCYKCWQNRRDPVLVPRFGTPRPSPDLLYHAVFYDSLTTLTPPTVALLGWTSALPTGAIRPLLYPKLSFSTALSEVCLTAATRNLRTGQVSLRARCTRLRPDDSDGGSADPLAALGDPNLRLSPPSDPGLEIGPARCASSVPNVFEGDTIWVAASYYAQRLDCNGCTEPTSAAQPTAAGAPGASQTPSSSSNSGCQGLPGCHSVQGSNDVAGLSWLVIGTAVLYVRRRRRWLR